MKIEVGKKYRTRDGDVVTIESTDDSGEYPFLGNNGQWYTRRGAFSSGSRESSFDLVEAVVDEQAAAEASEGICADAEPVAVAVDPLLRLMPSVVYSESPCRAALRLLLREVDARSLGRHEGTSDLSAAVAFARLALKDSAP